MLMTGSDEDNNKIDKTDESELERRRKKREEELYDIFYLFDKDRSGYISDSELASVMMQFGHLTEADVKIMIAEADIDGDGQVKRYEMENNLLHCSWILLLPNDTNLICHFILTKVAYKEFVHMMSKPGDDVQEERKRSSDIWNYMMYNIKKNNWYC